MSSWPHPCNVANATQVTYPADNVLSLIAMSRRSLSEIARAIGVHPCTVSRAVRGYTDPRLGLVIRMAELLGVSPGRLAGALHRARVERQAMTRATEAIRRLIGAP